MILNRNNGSISVFLMVVLFSIIILGGILFDAGRIRAGELMAKNVLDKAITSTLAGYHADLKEQYGIFALCENDTMVLNETVKSYILKNIITDRSDDKTLDLYGFRLEEVEVSSSSDIDNNNILRSQIIEHMKYRVPKKLVEGLIQMFHSTLRLGKRSDTMLKKTELEENMGRVEGLKVKLQKQADESKSFNSGGFFKKMLLSYIDLNEDKYELEEKLYKEDDDKEKKELKKKLTNVVREIEKKCKQIKEHVKSFCEINKNAIEIVSEVVIEMKEIAKKAEELEDVIEDDDEIFSKSIGENINIYKGNLSDFDVEKIGKELKYSNELIDKISQAVEKIDKVRIGDTCGDSRKDIENAIGYSEIIGLASDYDNALGDSDTNKKPDKSYGKYEKYDARESVEKALKNESWIISGDYDEEVNNEGNSANILGRVDFGSADFIKKAFVFISKAGKNINEATGNMKDEIYVNEYILEMFNNSVSTKSKADRDSFFRECEVEYILIGNLNEKFNRNVVKGEILLLRFASNMMHLYMDPSKNKDALNAAIAICGWTGFGVPVVHTLIMASWSMGESMMDIKDLLNGSEVPLFKTNKDWKLKMGAEGIKDALLKKSEEVVYSALDRITEGINDFSNKMIEQTVEELFEEVLGGESTYATKVEKLDEETDEIGRLYNEIKRIAKEEIDKIKFSGQQTVNSIAYKEKERIKNIISQRISQLKEKTVLTINENAKVDKEGVENYEEQDKGSSSKNDFLSNLLLVSYEDYLRLLLISRNSNTKIDRVKALINMNMSLHSSDFRLSGHSTSLRVKTIISMKYIFFSRNIFKRYNSKTLKNKHSFELIFDKGYD